jgi:hypothetical protein
MPDEITLDKSNIRDLQFGSQVLGDYAIFIHDALAPGETVQIKQASKFISLFNDLFAKSKEPLSVEQLAALNKKTFQDVQDIRKYILNILKLQINKNIIINLHTQNLNMMVTTSELLLDGLNGYMHDKFPNPSNLSSTWLQNIYITTLTLQDRLGILHFEERNKAGGFADTFLNLFSKSIVLDGMRRTGLTDFPALHQFYREIYNTMVSYATFLVDLINIISKNEYTGILTLLHIDNIYRRVCFFMTQLARVSDIPKPVCDSTSPRMQ